MLADKSTNIAEAMPGPIKTHRLSHTLSSRFQQFIVPRKEEHYSSNDTTSIAPYYVNIAVKILCVLQVLNTLLMAKGATAMFRLLATASDLIG